MAARAPRIGESGRAPIEALDRETAESLARTLRALADPTRLQLLSLIRRSDNAEATGGMLAEQLGLSQPTVSHHLHIMVDDGLLVRERRGRSAWFSVVPDRAAEIDDLLR